MVRGKWTEAIAVGSKEFVEATAERLGILGIGRQISQEKVDTNFGSQPLLTVVV